MLYGIPFGPDDWGRFGFFLVISLLFFTFFISLGVFISTLTQRPATSFLVSLAAWVTLVLIVPRLAVMAAGVADPVPSVAETEAGVDAFSKDRWDGQMKEMEARWQTRQEAMHGMSKEEREAYGREKEKEWSADDEAGRVSVQKDIDAFAVRVNEDLRNRKSHQEQLAFGQGAGYPVVHAVDSPQEGRFATPIGARDHEQRLAVGVDVATHDGPGHAQP